MKKIIGLIFLTLLFRCDTKDAIPELRFSGHVKDGDPSSSIKLANIKVNLFCFDSRSEIVKTDSTFTNEEGNYSFNITNEDSTITQYFIQIENDYIKKCSSFFPIDILIHRKVDELDLNSDTIEVCETGNIRLSVTKLNMETKDTLTINKTIKTNSADVILNSTIVTESKEWTDYYFTKSVIGIEYNFNIKRENGQLEAWSEYKAVEPKTTKELNVEF